MNWILVRPLIHLDDFYSIPRQVPSAHSGGGHAPQYSFIKQLHEVKQIPKKGAVETTVQIYANKMILIIQY